MGWKDGTISKSDFEIAKEEGYMFNYPKVITHKEALTKAKKIANSINRQDVINAFLYSLSTRKLEYRSAFASYYYILSIPTHEPTNEKNCYVCAWNKFEEKPNEYEIKLGLNVFNFERYKWGGVRHDSLNYALFDLENFIKLAKVNPSKEDNKILKEILEIVKELNPEDKAGKLLKAIQKKKIFPSNKDEVQVLLGIMGICDILSSQEYTGYMNDFHTTYERDPEEYKNDFHYPINRWKVKDGVDNIILRDLFGFVI